MNQLSVLGNPGATKRAPGRWLGPTAILALLCLAQSAWAHDKWPTEYSIRYKSYNSPTDNKVELSYKVSGPCYDNEEATSIEGVGINWCRPTDDAWDGQFWGPWNVGPDPQPQCRSDWKPDGGGGWWHGGHGAQIWPNGRDGKKCDTTYKHDIDQPLAPGLWAIGLNYWDDNVWAVFHHNSGHHNTNRVFELVDPNAPDDDEDDNDND